MVTKLKDSLLETRKLIAKDSYEDYFFVVLKLCSKVNSKMDPSDIIDYLRKDFPARLVKEIHSSIEAIPKQFMTN